MPKDRISVWSIDDEEFNLDFFPYTIKTLLYKPWCNGEFENTVEFGNGTTQPTMKQIRDACDKLVLASEDMHHIFIENFRDKGNGVWELETGS